jgi:YegS/Rv2252/BmrU family lipid kinase
MMKNRVFFIINRFSGRGYRQSLEQEILARCEESGLRPTLEFTGHPGHATELAGQAAAENFPMVFAVGGDGTVNEAASGLVRTGTALGIVPRGSGNGLARHLGIPMAPAKALGLLGAHQVVSMDALLINGRYSFNVSGIGFDGHVAGKFGQNGKRGLAGYVSAALREFPGFKEFGVDAKVDGLPLQQRAFIVAFANSSQFGNGATIAPGASLCDGKMDLCLIRKPSYLQVGSFLGKLFTGRLDRSKSVKIVRATEFSAVLDRSTAGHIDGEPCAPATVFSVRLEPACLKILAPAATGPI